MHLKTGLLISPKRKGRNEAEIVLVRTDAPHRLDLVEVFALSQEKLSTGEGCGGGMRINGEAASLKLTKEIEVFITSLLARQRQSVLEEAAKVADRRAEILSILGPYSSMKQIMTHAEIQFEGILEAKKIAEDIRALKNAEEKS